MTPVFHQKADRIRGHILGSFLSLLLAISLRKAVETQLDKEASDHRHLSRPGQTGATQREPTV